MPPRFDPVVSIIGFHHAKGPEVEHWIGVEDESTLTEWPLLPFMALSDGAHSSSEDFSYFTLKHLIKHPDGTPDRPISLFGISCTRQLDSNTLIDRPADVTRSTVQKAVVVIADSPVYFGGLKEKLGMVTKAWFAQRNFDDLDIIRKFQESLKMSLSDDNSDREQYLGLSLRELLHEFRQETLVLFKCCLLQPKMLFFGSRCDRLCMTQFSLLSLIPGLLRALEDCADPDLNYYEGTLFKPTSVKTSDRKSLLTFMGMPLQIFGKGSLFGPYTPLQQLDILADVGTKSYVVGSTNSLLLQQKDRYSDILINLDEHTINITSTSLRNALYLTSADKRWIDSIVMAVIESWDENDPSRPKTMGFVGSEEYIRLQFEEYVLSMVSSVKCHDFLNKHAGSPSALLPDVDGDPAMDFGMEFIDMWKRTENYRIFQKFTDSELFDLVPPKHLMAGGLSMDDVSRRISQQLNDLKLDEKMVNGRDAVAKTLVAGRGKIGAAFSTLSQNVAQLREAQAKKLKEQEQRSPAPSIAPSVDSTEVTAEKVVEQPQPAKPAAAGGYFSAWASWAGEKKRKAFGGTPVETPASSPPMKPSTSEDVTSTASSIGSPKVARNSHGEELYDAETGIGRGDSGVISPAYRASLDMHPDIQSSPNGKSEVESRKGLGIFSKITEGLVDLRKSLPAPPPPEKQAAPNFADKVAMEKKAMPEPEERSDEDREFLRNLRKSLPPPPSEIDDLPIRMSLVTAPGPMVAQEVFDDHVVVDTAPPSEPLVQNELPKKTEAPAINSDNKLTKTGNSPVDFDEAPVEAQPTGPEVPVRTVKVDKDVKATDIDAKPEPELQPIANPSKTRFKARGIIRQYVAQENALLPKPDELIQDTSSFEDSIMKELNLSESKNEAPVGATTEDVRTITPTPTAPETRHIEQHAKDDPAAAPKRKSILKNRDSMMDRRVSPLPSTEEVVTVEPEQHKPLRPESIIRPSEEQKIEKFIEPTVEPKVERRKSKIPRNDESDADAPKIVVRKYRKSSASENPLRRRVESVSQEWNAPIPTEQTVEGDKIEQPATETSAAARARARNSMRSQLGLEQEEGRRQSSMKEDVVANESPMLSLAPGFPNSPERAVSDGSTGTQVEASLSSAERPVRFKARGLIRKYVAQEQAAEQAAEQTAEPSIARSQEQHIVETKYDTIPPATVDPVVSNPDQVVSDAQAVEATATVRPARFKARGLIRKYVAKEQELESGREAEISKPEELAQEEFTPEPIRRKATMQAAKMTEPTQEEITHEPARRKFTLQSSRAEQPTQEEFTAEPIRRKSTMQVPKTEEPVPEEFTPEPIRRKATMPRASRTDSLTAADTPLPESPAPEPRIFRRKTTPLPPTSPPPAESKDSEHTEPMIDTPRRRRKSMATRDITPATSAMPAASLVYTADGTTSAPVDTPKVSAGEPTPKTPLTPDSTMRKSVRRAVAEVNGENKAIDGAKSPLTDPPKRKAIPAVFTQDASAPPETTTSTASPKRVVGVLPTRVPSPNLITSAPKIATRSRSGTLLNGPPGAMSLNKAVSPPLPSLANFKDLQKSIGNRSPSPTKDSASPLPGADKPRSPFNSGSLGRSPTTDSAAAVAESRTGPGRIGGGLKNNPFLKNDSLASPTEGADAPGRKRVGTLKNNPFIKNDLKSPTSPPPPPSLK